MKKQILIAFIFVLLVIGGLSFYGGMVYGKSSATKTAVSGQAAGRNFAGGAGGAIGARTSGGLVNGAVLSKDDKSITVQSRAGGSKIVFFSANTTVQKMGAGSVSDISQGDQVMITGSTNSDGSVTAQSIEIRPAMPAGNANASQTAPTTTN